MPDLQEVDGTLCLIRKKHLDDAERNINRGYYLLITSPMKSGVTTFLRMVVDYLREKYSTWHEYLIDLSVENHIFNRIDISLMDEVNKKFPTSDFNVRQETCSTCPIEECFVKSLSNRRTILETHGKVILLLDNFHKVNIFEQKRFLQQLKITYSSKNLCEHLNRLIFILGGAVDLDIIDPSKTSPFFAGSNIHLEDFTLEQSQFFISQYLYQYESRKNKFSNIEELFLYDLTLGHPYLLNAILKTVSDKVKTGEVVPFQILKQSISDMLEGRDEFFDVLRTKLAGCSQESINLLIKILLGYQIKEGLIRQLTDLYQLGIVRMGDEGYVKIRNPLVEYFLRKEPKINNEIFRNKVATPSLISIATPNINNIGLHSMINIESLLKNFVFCKLYEKYGSKWLNVMPAIIADQIVVEDAFLETINEPKAFYIVIEKLRIIIVTFWKDIFEEIFKSLDTIDNLFDTLLLIKQKVQLTNNFIDQDIAKLESISVMLLECLRYKNLAMEGQDRVIKKNERLIPGDHLPKNSEGRYEIIDAVSAFIGSNNIVYCAIDHQQGEKKIVIKEPAFFYEQEKWTTEELKSLYHRYERELSILTTVRHTNIVSVLDFIDKRYVVEEWIDEKNLRQVMDEKEALSIQQIIQIGLEVGDTLSFLYDNYRIVHRNLCPEYIYLNSNGHVRLCGFGLEYSKMDHQLEGNEQNINFSPCRLPEQYNNKNEEISFRVDIFALGAILYQLFFHEYPSTEGSFYINSGDNDSPVHLSSKESSLSISESLEKCVLKMLSLIPDERFHSWGSFINIFTNEKISYEKTDSLISKSNSVKKSFTKSLDIQSAYTNGIVAIKNGNECVGTGFLVQHKKNPYLVTCAHVIKKLNLSEGQYVETQHFDLNMGENKAQIIWYRPKPDVDPKYWTAKEDIAILRAQFQNFDPSHLSVLDIPKDYASKKDCWCFGYLRSRGVIGDWIRKINCTDQVAQGLYKLSQSGHVNFELGISGSPLSDPNGKIIGMIQAIFGNEEAYLIPSKNIQEILMKLETQL